jgi:hypothetical protein
MPAEQRALTSGALFEDGEVVVIGDEPANTIKDRQAPSETAVSRGEGELLTVPKPRAVGLLPVCPTVKPVGEPDALSGTSGSMSVAP